MAPGTNIGAAHPVTAGGKDVPSTMEEKVLNDMLAFARSIGAQRGRNTEWLEEAVRKSISATAEEAFAKNVVDLIADNLPDLLERLDGWELKHKGVTKILHTKGVEERTIHPGWQHKVLRAISNPNIAYILLMIGLAGLYFELSQPGVVVPGVIGGISLILALYAMQTLPVNYAGFLFILLAVVFSCWKSRSRPTGFSVSPEFFPWFWVLSCFSEFPVIPLSSPWPCSSRPS